MIVNSARFYFIVTELTLHLQQAEAFRQQLGAGNTSGVINLRLLFRWGQQLKEVVLFEEEGWAYLRQGKLDVVPQLPPELSLSLVSWDSVWLSGSEFHVVETCHRNR